MTTPAPLVDTFGRTVRKLRVSVTDRCNFRCTYCMPEEGVSWLPKGQILTFEEITRICTLMVRLGVTKLRLTGGEPLVRARLVDLVRKLRAIPGLAGLSITTNGYFLAEQAEDLVAAGLTSFNVSLDTLERARFKAMTRRDALDRVLEGLGALERLGVAPIKINAVVMRGQNEDDIERFAEMARRGPYVVRFIEFMPLEGGYLWRNDLIVPGHEVLERIARVYPIEPDPDCDPRDPSRDYRFVDGAGKVGFINSVTEPFCASCDRMRLTADGQLRTCLFATDEHNLRDLLRSGASDEALEAFIRQAVSTKWAGHLINRPGFVRPSRTMSAIGG
ncbi:MAG TPA: GTP 3',8-cyclase MoaA [Thermodesulfobacteriota bacterium]